MKKNMEELKDTGSYLEVDEDQRLDVDEGEALNALEGGDDTKGLEDIYANPDQLPEEVKVSE